MSMPQLLNKVTSVVALWILTSEPPKASFLPASTAHSMMVTRRNQWPGRAASNS